MKSDAYYLAELEDKLLETIYEYVRTIKRPFGVLISGGFDSGLLAAVSKPDYVYTVSFPYGPRYDESRYADSIIKHLGLEDKTTIIQPTKSDFEENFRAAVEVMQEPVSHFSLVPLYILFKKIRDDKLTTLDINILSGEGPDEYLGGYARQIIFDEFKKLYEIPELRNYHGVIDKVLDLAGPAMSFDNQLAWLYGKMMGYDKDKTGGYLTDPYPLQGKIGKMDMELGVIEKMEQKLADHFGINLYYPYINEDLAEYCYALPDHLKIRNGVTKWAFREICKKYLPEYVWDRSKMGGPVFPVNKLMGWSEDEFDKTVYLQKQEEILYGKPKT